jgi:glycosyltransferase involved in cell wall biosynthesis
MSNCLISILLPVKNASVYLTDCINSILFQSETDWELFAIDDHSEDNSFEILEKYAQQDSRIKVFKNEGNGIIPALRKAYAQSNGHLITRMDADDTMVPKKLERLKTLLLRHGSNHIATGLVKYFSKNKLGDGYLRYQNWLNTLSLEENNFHDIYKECVIPSPCWMVFREDLDKCSAFELDIYPEDYDLCFRFYKSNLIVKTVPEVLHHWRDYAERTSRNDPNYSDVHFFDLKIKYFLTIDYDKNRPLIIWGAGRKGKQLAQALNDQKIPFRWITDNPRKIDHIIYNIKMESVECLINMRNPQLIIAVAAPEALIEIQEKLDNLSLEKAKDYFFFC